jgi:hypothetical protein
LSSNFRPRAAAAAAAAFLAVLLGAGAPAAARLPAAATAIAAAAAPAADTTLRSPRPRHRIRPPKAPIVPAPAPAPASAADESLAFARNLVNDIRASYGGDDAWALMDGLRYDVAYVIPGPEGTPVRRWTEVHHVWLGGEPRVRIDTVEDSTIVVVSGDTTRVRQGGAWTTEPAVVSAARRLALDVRWIWRLPRNLGNPAIRARIQRPIVRGEPFTLRYFYERPGLDREEGTIVDVTFAPPAYTVRQLHWFEPRARTWFLLDFDTDRQRYGWTWAERRTLRASDEAGEPGPVLWTATVQDMQIESRMPLIVLSPPGAGAGVVSPAAPAAADSSRR